MAKALIVDDERDICELIEMGIRGQGIEGHSVYNIKSALKKLKEEKYDLIISDIRLPDGDGLDLLAHINKNYPQIPVCMITAHGNMDMAVKALRLGAFDFIQKPFNLKQLRAICKSAISGKQNLDKADDENTTNKSNSKKTSKHQLIGTSNAMERVRLLINKVSKSQAPVFINGESGVGKEVVARCIHNTSTRNAGPFIAVNCGAIPENLVESEFFGYKKGSFTGANQDTPGLFASANGGTLFLDEIADLPLSMQVKLLRAIQERAVRPIGGDKEESVDVRIISASHKNLREHVISGLFREDLYYRLNVIGIDLPPLRERLSDVPELANFLLEKIANNFGQEKVEISKEALQKLQNYNFPGNVRELENILERALTFAESPVISAEDIQINVDKALSSSEKLSETNADNNLEDYLLILEREAILKSLKRNSYDLIETANDLGITFRILQNKLKKLGIEI